VRVGQASLLWYIRRVGSLHEDLRGRHYHMVTPILHGKRRHRPPLIAKLRRKIEITHLVTRLLPPQRVLILLRAEAYCLDYGYVIVLGRWDRVYIDGEDFVASGDKEILDWYRSEIWFGQLPILQVNSV
jgi:hypothetical protein